MLDVENDEVVTALLPYQVKHHRTIMSCRLQNVICFVGINVIVDHMSCLHILGVIWLELNTVSIQDVNVPVWPQNLTKEHSNYQSRGYRNI